MTEPAYVTETRAAYETVARSYAGQLQDALDTNPWDRQYLVCSPS